MTILHSPTIRIVTIFFVFCGLWMGFTPSAHAHRVTVFAWAEGDRIHSESKFANGKPVVGGKIVVVDAANQQILTGTTDQEGRFTFVSPKPPPLKIELLAGMGHKSHWIVEAEDKDDHTTAAHQNTAPTQRQPALANKADTVAFTAQEIETIVAKTLDQKLAPIHRALARQEQNQQNRTRDIFAGVGYILGLVGVGAYVHYRKKSVLIDFSRRRSKDLIPNHEKHERP